MTAIGHDTIRRRKHRKPLSKLLNARGDTELSYRRWGALQERAEEMRRAKKEWGALPAWKRFCLDAIGYDPLSWSARKELRDLARRAKEASKMVKA